LVDLFSGGDASSDVAKPPVSFSRDDLGEFSLTFRQWRWQGRSCLNLSADNELIKACFHTPEQGGYLVLSKTLFIHLTIIANMGRRDKIALSESFV
jgi:hypothetical protein